ncbi:ElyC/SanA/YdcF family protein [Nibricoccus sp. IMCC34717]|uniref:ElyC/SanA/YdcF family protein n=1 Tax=Nibricoccus sp. IMCC34717 TaxID=3034021 RepID=UPI00384F3DAD
MLFRRATIYVPTRWGWLTLLLCLIGPITWWALRGEAFLSVNEPVAADILVVEGWIGRDGIQHAARVYQAGNYKWVVTVGVDGEGWKPDDHNNYAQAAAAVLGANGVPKDKILKVPLERVAVNRTLSSAEGVRDVLARAGIVPIGLNVVTRGCHARRSRLTFQRVFRDISVGTETFWRVRAGETQWWHSTDRGRDFLDETFLYLIALTR